LKHKIEKKLKKKKIELLNGEMKKKIKQKEVFKKKTQNTNPNIL